MSDKEPRCYGRYAELEQLHTELTAACAARDALAVTCHGLESAHDHNVSLVLERDEKLAQARSELAQRQESQAYTDGILRTTNDELAEALTQARDELAAVDEALGSFYCPVLDPETNGYYGAFFKDHGVSVMHQALEMTKQAAAEYGLEALEAQRQLAQAEAQVAATRAATEELWRFWDGNSLRAIPGFEDDIREAWDNLLVATDMNAATKLLERLEKTEGLEKRLASMKAARDYWRREYRRNDKRLEALGAAETALADCGISGIYDDFNGLPDAIKQMVERLVQLEGGQELQAERQLRQGAERCTDDALERLEEAEQYRKHFLLTESAQHNYIAGLRDRLEQAKQRAERAEALAQLVTLETARLLEKMATANVSVYEAHRANELVAQIREALDDKQALA